MKKINYTLIVLIAISIRTFAQIPNSGFENWTTVGNCSRPTSWYNMYYLVDSSGSYCSATMSSDHFPASIGNYSVRITNDTAIWNTGIAPGDMLGWGLLVSAKTGDRPLFPVTGHPKSLCGYYKFLPQKSF